MLHAMSSSLQANHAYEQRAPSDALAVRNKALIMLLQHRAGLEVT